MEQKGTLKELPSQDPAAKLYTIDEKSSSFVYNWHEDLEIILIKTGRLTVQTENKIYELKRNDVLIIDIDSAHAIRSRHPFKALILKIPRELLKKSIPEIDNLSFFITAKKDIKDQIRDKLEVLMHYTKPIEQGDQILFNIHLYELIYICYRHCSNTLEKSITDSRIKGRRKLRDTINYINKNFANQITLTALASMTGVQSNYFCRLFKKCYGITVRQYIYDRRFCKIAHELINTTLPISTIMKNSGFSNWELFNRLFNDRFSITAGTFRKRYKRQRLKAADGQEDKES